MGSGVKWLITTRFNVRTRLKITALLLVAALAATAVGTLVVDVDVSEAQDFIEEFQEELERSNDVRLIFGNNLIHTLIMFVPIVGPIWGFFVLFNTGVIIAVFSVAEGVPPILSYTILLLTPILWLEIGVYSVAMAQSIILFLQKLRRRGKKEAIRTCILVTISALVLLLSATVEWILINI